jgi:lipoprotein signal peptidase
MKRWIIFGTLILFDQGLKFLVMRFGNWQLNSGIALGWGSNFSFWWPGIIIGLMAIILIKFKLSLGTILITAGGVSNLIDRWRVGGVIDYGNFFGLFQFNLADVFILAGVMSLLYSHDYETSGNYLRR